MSVPQWAGMTGLADDDKSLATARGLIAKGEGPKVTKVMRRTRNGPVAVDGVRLVDHQAWARSQPWAKYLATLTASECEKRQRLKDKGRSRAWPPTRALRIAAAKNFGDWYGATLLAASSHR
jgi:hypothetical protein